MLTDAEVRKAVQLLISRYGARNALSAASFRCLELAAMGEFDAAIQWQAIADALKTPHPLQQPQTQPAADREPRGLRLVG